MAKFVRIDAESARQYVNVENITRIVELRDAPGMARVFFVDGNVLVAPLEEAKKLADAADVDFV